jgi:hypothetical protein
MIASKIKKNNDWRFPRLGICVLDKVDHKEDVGNVKYTCTTIVLFTGCQWGTVVHSDGFLNDNEIGLHRTTWCMEDFEPFYGEVILK